MNVPRQPDYETLLHLMEELLCFSRAPRPLTRVQRRILRRCAPRLLTVYEARLRAPAPSTVPASSPPPLTSGQIFIGIAIWEGKTNSEIARARGTNIRTVETQIRTLFAKLGVERRIPFCRCFEQLYLRPKNLLLALFLPRMAELPEWMAGRG